MEKGMRILRFGTEVQSFAWLCNLLVYYIGMFSFLFQCSCSINWRKKTICFVKWTVQIMVDCPDGVNPFCFHPPVFGNYRDDCMNQRPELSWSPYERIIYSTPLVQGAQVSSCISVCADTLPFYQRGRIWARKKDSVGTPSVASARQRSREDCHRCSLLSLQSQQFCY